METTKRLFASLLVALTFAWALPAMAQEIKGLDKEFYNAYLDSLPNEKKQRLEMLQKNLVTVLKRVIPREDPDHGAAYLPNIKIETMQFEELQPNSPFVRGMQKEIPGFRMDKHMFIIKSGPYLIYAAFAVNPRLYVTGETQRFLIRRTEATHE